MATKMNATIAKRVNALKIEAKNEEEAREKLLKILVNNGIEGMEEEETETLLDIAESFAEDNGASEEPQTEEEENDALAAEVEAEDNGASEEPQTEEEENDEEPEEVGEAEPEDEFVGMDRTTLKAYIKSNKLDVVVKKSMSDEDIREAIRAAVSSENEEENEDELPTTPVPAPAPKKEKKTEKKTEKKATTSSKRGTKLDPKNNEEDREVLEPWKKLFPEDEYTYAWLASAGVTIKHKGKNSQRSMISIENCSKMDNGEVTCNIYLLTFNKQTDVLEKAGIDFEICWSGAPFMKNIPMNEAVEIVSGLMEQIIQTVQKIDKKLGENRQKMEKNLDKKTSKKK